MSPAAIRTNPSQRGMSAARLQIGFWDASWSGAG
jgi:hypothetical protein